MRNVLYQDVTFYIVAHPDDWQLFMMPNAKTDLSNLTTKVVFIQLTAGDNGLGSPYWQAREQGAIASIRYWLAQADTNYFIHQIEDHGTRLLNGHHVRYWGSKNAVGYYLRLPDGNLHGQGFELYHYQSLKHLAGDPFQSIAAVDGSETYDSVSDLVSTLEAIVSLESAGFGPTLRLQYQDPDTTLNCIDHSDHTMTGSMVEKLKVWSAANNLLFLDYVIDSKPKDITIEDLFWKSALFAAYEKSVQDLAGHSDSGDRYENFCLRTAHYRHLVPTV